MDHTHPLSRIPPEILSLILGYLPYSDFKKHDDDEQPWKAPHLCNARLVCRQWNALAAQHLFRTIKLLHHPDDDEFSVWNAQVDSQVVQNNARVAEIHSGPLDHMRLGEGRDVNDWACWESDDWEEFATAIERLGDLRGINEVFVRFSDKCIGVETTAEESAWEDEHVEKPSTRLNTLKHVFVGMWKHREGFGSVEGGITKLSIENLANHPLEQLVQMDEFESVVKGIKELRVSVIEEVSEAHPDSDLYNVERTTFEPWLQSELLPAFMDGLTVLDLGFSNGYWGVAPGTFDGKGLEFPNLKRLSLRHFVIGHDDGFDWVLRMTGLEKLYLNECFIADYIRIEEKEVREWGVRTHDWVRVSEGNGFRYEYRGTWEKVFRRMREEMTSLVDFRFAFWEDAPIFAVPDFRDWEEPGDGRYASRRYVGFYSGMISPWNIGESDRCETAWDADKNAFEELVKVTLERRARTVC
ncbi:hypothetical protein QBC43DRAFT_319127 [Cladorrhinum sp. PSN259]|nr:hypothetical protein QBC43DRAFT_319127 [Cladorrhinum sp. PSN259]